MSDTIYAWDGVQNMVRMETSQLRCFLAVAEELHFGRAAQRLNMTQPPLSRQIQLLEKQLGSDLFLRTSRSVLLTPAGESLRADADKILRLMESAASSVKKVSEGSQGNVRFGFTAASAYQFLPMLLRRISEAIPGAAVTLKEMVSSSQISALESAELDMGLLRPPVDHTEFVSALAARESMIMALPRGHALTRQRCIEWPNVNTLDLIMYDSHEARYFYELLAGQFVQHGVFPRYRQHVTQIHTILALVRAGIGAAIVPQSATVLDTTEIEYRPFAGSRPFTADLYFVWRRNNRNPLVDAIVALAAQTGMPAEQPLAHL